MTFIMQQPNDSAFSNWAKIYKEQWEEADINKWRLRKKVWVLKWIRVTTRLDKQYNRRVTTWFWRRVEERNLEERNEMYYLDRRGCWQGIFQQGERYFCTRFHRKFFRRSFNPPLRYLVKFIKLIAHDCFDCGRFPSCLQRLRHR